MEKEFYIQIKWDFNTIRKDLINNFNSLCEKLNDSIIEDGLSTEMILDPSEIKEEIIKIRIAIGMIASLYLEDDPVLEPVDFPLATFNI